MVEISPDILLQQAAGTVARPLEQIQGKQTQATDVRSVLLDAQHRPALLAPDFTSNVNALKALPARFVEVLREESAQMPEEVGAVESSLPPPTPHVVQRNVEALAPGELFPDVHSQPRPDNYTATVDHDTPPAEQRLPRIGNHLPPTSPTAYLPEGGPKPPVGQTTVPMSIESYPKDASRVVPVVLRNERRNEAPQVPSIEARRTESISLVGQEHSPVVLRNELHTDTPQVPSIEARRTESISPVGQKRSGQEGSAQLDLAADQRAARVLDPRPPDPAVSSEARQPLTPVFGAVGTLPAAATTQPLPVLDVALPGNPSSWGETITERVIWLVQRDLPAAQLRLNPPHLGAIEVRISLDNDQATISFIVASSQVREALEAALPRLQHLMEESGLELAEANVSDPRSGGGDASSQESKHVLHDRQSAPSGDSDVQQLPAPPLGQRLVDAYA